MINSSETQMLTMEMEGTGNIVFKCVVIGQKTCDNDLDFYFDHHCLGYSMVNYFQL